MRLCALSFTLLSVPFFLAAQTPADSVSLRNNVIKVDFTSRLMYRNAYVLSWEHVVKPSQSFVVSFGYQEFRPITLDIAERSVRDVRSQGLKASGEYRFYLKSENKYNAPRGVYLGPYASYLNFTNRRNITDGVSGVDGELDMEITVQILHLGAQIGYQFVLWDRLTIDLVFLGPSVSNYAIDRKIYSSFEVNEDEITGEVIGAILDRFPGMEDLLNFEDESYTRGSSSQWSFGMRYQVHLGYKFGTRNLFRKKA